MPAPVGTKPLKPLKKGMGLYQVIYWPKEAPDKSKPWAVVNLQTRDANGRYHATQAEAAAQAKALYARLGNKARYGMAEPHSILAPVQFSEQKDNLLWLEALPAKTWHTKEFGEVAVTVESLQRMVDNFYGNVRGQEVPTNYNHGLDRSKGDKASGWIREAQIRDESLWLGIEPTSTAAEELENNEWKYFSLEWDDFEHPETQEVHQDVIFGGGFTNTPIAKGMVPINFSELFEVTPKKFANLAPYGNVTYADPGFQADKKKRYPLSTEKKIRAAWSYISMPRNAGKYSSSQLASIKSKIIGAMKRIGAKVQMSEATIEKELNDTLMAEEEATRIIETDEHADVEHSEPGQADNPDPNTNEDTSFPDRHVTLPTDNDDDTTKTDEVKMDDLDKQIREKLGLDEKADILKAVDDLKEEVGPLREVAKQFSEKKAFAEQFPEQAAELDRLTKLRVQDESIKFSEKFGEKRIADKGLSALALTKIRESHLKFSEGNMKVEDLDDLLETITNEKGLVEFSERGSTQHEHIEMKEAANPRIAFSELVKSIQESDKLEYEAAIKVAAEKRPDLAEGYFKPVRA